MLEKLQEGNSLGFFVIEVGCLYPAGLEDLVQKAVLLTSTSCQASILEIQFFPVKKLGRVTWKGECSCLSAGISGKIAGHLVIAY